MNAFLQQYWPLLLPACLGFLAVLWLMPRARGSRPLLGLMVAAAAVLTGGMHLIHLDTSWQERWLFYIFAFLAILGGVLVITQRNPVHAALSFAVVVLSSCGLFLLQAAPFLFAATIIVYAGAIVVTFLFVIMLAQQEGLSDADARTREPFLASLAGFLLMAALFVVLHRTYDTSEVQGLLKKVDQLSQANAKEEVDRILGPEGVTSPLVEALVDYFPQVDAVSDLDAQRRDLPKLRATANKVLEETRPALWTHGNLQASPTLPLTGHSGRPANAPAPTDGKERLPAGNVAALGRSLFTDYLVPVELAGILLLVATIGAICIAGRHPEGLR